MAPIPASEREKRRKAKAQSQSASSQWKAAAKAKGQKAPANPAEPTAPAPPVPVIPAAPSVPMPNGAPGLPAAPVSPFPDWQLDASYLDTTSRAAADLESARGRTLEGQRGLLLQLGDPELAKTILGGADPTVAAIGANPFSTLAQLKRTFDERQTGTTENLNKMGLLYSGARGKALADLSTQYQGDVYSAQASAQEQLTRLRDGLAGAETGYRDTIAAAAGAAKERAQAEAIAYGYGYQDPTAAPAAPAAPGAPAPVDPNAYAQERLAADRAAEEARLQASAQARQQTGAKRKKAKAQATSAGAYWRNAAAAQGRR